MVRTETITWQQFERDMLRKGDVERVDVVNKETVEVYIKRERLSEQRHKKISERPFFKGINTGPHYSFNIGTLETFENDMEKAQENYAESDRVAVEFVNRKNWLGDSLGWIITLGIMIAFWLFIIRRMSPGGGASGGSSIFNSVRIAHHKG